MVSKQLQNGPYDEKNYNINGHCVIEFYRKGSCEEKKI